MSEKESSLIEAAVALGASYNQVLRLVLVGDLKGTRRAGRWFVDREDLARLRSERATQCASVTGPDERLIDAAPNSSE